MNLSVITAQIIKQPKLVKVNNYNMMYMSVIVPNEKKTTSFFQLYVYSTINKYKDLCDLYRVKDIVILTGYIYVKQHSNHVLKSYDYMVMKADDIQPYIAYI